MKTKDILLLVMYNMRQHLLFCKIKFERILKKQNRSFRDASNLHCHEYADGYPIASLK